MQRTTLGPYRLLELLHSSRPGEVFLAEDGEKGEAVVVRVFPPETPESGDRYERVLHDARAASALEDPRIESTVDAGRIEGCVFLAAAPMGGPSLADTLREEGTLPPRDVARIGLDLAEILARAHARGVVHRALEPAHVYLVGPERAVRLGGFGLACASESEPSVRDRTVPLTPYLAPEQASDERADRRADTYALGAVLWEALTGEPPTQPPDTTHIPEGTPPLLPHLLLALLSPDPGARPTALSEEARALRELLATPKTPPRESPVDESEPRLVVAPPMSRKRAALLVGAGALIVTAARLLWRLRR